MSSYMVRQGHSESMIRFFLCECVTIPGPLLFDNYFLLVYQDTIIDKHAKVK